MRSKPVITCRDCACRYKIAELAQPRKINIGSNSFVSKKWMHSWPYIPTACVHIYMDVCVCVCWQVFGLLFLVVLPGELSRRLGGLVSTVTRWSYCCNSCVTICGAHFSRKLLQRLLGRPHASECDTLFDTEHAAVACDFWCL